MVAAGVEFGARVGHGRVIGLQGARERIGLVR